MQYKFLNIFLNPKELLAQSKTPIDPILLENNTAQIEKIYNFYKDNINLLYVNGFLGTGKATIVEYSLAFLSAETIILKYDCFNSTVLDDLLLSVFVEFKKLSAQNIIAEPKIKTENFTQKVNSFFSQIERPFVIILDSFEEILDENRQEILDFIFHLNSIPKIKIVIIGKTFESKYFKDIPIERVTTFALEKQIFEKYIKSEKIKTTTGLVDELYKHTRGYYFYTKFSVRLIKKDNLTLFDFLTKLKESFSPFHEFIGKQALSLVPVSERNLFWFLAIIRHPVNINLLKKLNFYDEEKVNFLIENLILAEDNSQLHVRNYLKEQAYESIPASVSQRIRQYIVDLYLTQLPLKPFERDICISRQTMRKEIEYHKLFLPKKPKNIENTNVDINYLSYSHVTDFGSKVKNEEIKPEEEAKETPLDLTQRKNISINIENLPFQTKSSKIYDESISSIKKSQKTEIKDEYNNLNLKEIIEIARQAEGRYNYQKAIEIYKKALSMEKDIDYKINLPVLYTKIAHAYQKVANYENSLKYYELAKNVYQETQNHSKINQINYNIASILYETYKIENAKQLFKEIIDSQESSKNLIAKTYLQLANIEENSAKPESAFKYYQEAANISDEITDEKTLSELYFKYALALDDRNDSKSAIEFYNKCIQVNQDFKINKFLSPAYSNIATLYLEKNDTENARKNYTKAYEIDSLNNNTEGMYYSSSKLATILQRKQPEEALKYFETALNCAKSTKDIFYIVSASLALGDYHYDIKQDEIALKNYIFASNLAQKNLSQDNIEKINIRINDIKFRMGEANFNTLIDIIRKQENE